MTSKVLAVLAELVPAATFVHRRLTAEGPVTRAIDRTAQTFRPLKDLIPESLQNWLGAEETHELLLEIKRGSGDAEISDRLIELLQDRATIPGLTARTAEGILTTFVEHLRRERLKEDDGLWALEESIKETVRKEVRKSDDRVVNRMRSIVEVGRPISTDTESDTVRLTQRFDAVKSLLDERRPSAALEVLERIQNEFASDTGRDSRRRLHMQRGVAFLLQDAFDDAEEAFRRAQDYAPEDPLVIAQLAQVHLFRGDLEEAERLAAAAIGRDDECGLAWSVQIQASDDAAGPDIPEEVDDEQLVLAAQAVVQYRCGNTGRSVDLLREALRRGDRNPQVLILLADALYTHEIESNPIGSIDGDVFGEIHRYTDEALELLEDSEDAPLRCRALVVKAVTELHDSPQIAVSHLHEAQRLCPENNRVNRALAVALLEVGEFSGALHFLSKIPPDERDATFHSLKARVLVDAGRPDSKIQDQLQAARTKLDDHPERDRILLDLIETAVVAGLKSIAEQILEELGEEAPTYLRRLMEARVGILNSNFDFAGEAYQDAAEHAPENAGTEILTEYGVQLHKQGRYEDAISVLEDAGAGEREGGPRELLCQSLVLAGRLDRAEELLDQEAQEGDLPPWALDAASVIALQRADFEAAVEYLRGLERPGDADRPIARCRLAYALIRMGHRDEAMDELQAVVDGRADGLSPDLRVRVGQLFLTAGAADRALEFAYESLRQYPDVAELKQLFVQSFLERSSDEEVEAPDNIRENTFVRLETVSHDEAVEYFIVDNPLPGHPQEISTEHPSADLMMGLSEGDTITLREGTASEEDYRITAIQSGYVYTFQETLRRFPTQHPDVEALQRIGIGQPGSVRYLLPIISSLHRQQENVTQVLEFYNARGIPLGSVASLLGHTIRRIFRHFMGTTERVVAVEFGRPGPRQRSLQAAHDAEEVIVTITALSTLEEVGELELLNELYERLLTPPALLDELDAEIAEWEGRLRRGQHGTMTMAGPVPHYEEVPSEAVEEELALIKRLRDYVLSETAIVAPPGQAEEEDPRLADLVDEASLQSMRLMSTGASLLCDDLGLRRLATEVQSADHFSSYALLQEAASQEVLSTEEANLRTAELVGLNQVYISLSAGMLLDLLRDRGFQLTPTVRQVFERLRPDHTDSWGAIRVVAGVLRELALHPIGRAYLRPVAQCAFEALTRSRDPRPILSQLRTILQHALVLVPLSLQEIEEEMRAFIATKEMAATGF